MKFVTRRFPRRKGRTKAGSPTVPPLGAVPHSGTGTPPAGQQPPQGQPPSPTERYPRPLEGWPTGSAATEQAASGAGQPATATRVASAPSRHAWLGGKRAITAAVVVAAVSGAFWLLVGTGVLGLLFFPDASSTGQPQGHAAGGLSDVAPSLSTSPITLTQAPSDDSALLALQRATVKGRAAKTGYARDLFGPTWFDADANGCDTRNDILQRDLDDFELEGACRVRSGVLEVDPYTGHRIEVSQENRSVIEVDHVVPLADAWQKGAAQWDSGKRLAFANDPLNLLLVDASANRQKKDGDAATWLPANHDFRCTYVAQQLAVKLKYEVWLTKAEHAAMESILSTCPTLKLPAPGPAPTTAAGPTPSASVKPTSPQGFVGPTAPAKPPLATTRAPQPPPPPPPPPPAPPTDTYYAKCADARAAGVAPIYRGQPGYRPGLDRDNDGIACE